jgi:putative membrane protein
MYDRMYGAEWAGPIFFLLVVALLVVGAILVARTIVNRPTATHAPPPSAAGPSDGPLRILEERFARGEIDEDEFRRRRDILRS